MAYGTYPRTVLEQPAGRLQYQVCTMYYVVRLLLRTKADSCREQERNLLQPRSESTATALTSSPSTARPRHPSRYRSWQRRAESSRSHHLIPPRKLPTTRDLFSSLLTEGGISEQHAHSDSLTHAGRNQSLAVRTLFRNPSRKPSRPTRAT